jgi:hypothetical protein
MVAWSYGEIRVEVEGMIFLVLSVGHGGIHEVHTFKIFKLTFDFWDVELSVKP